MTKISCLIIPVQHCNSTVTHQHLNWLVFVCQLTSSRRYEWIFLKFWECLATVYVCGCTGTTVNINLLHVHARTNCSSVTTLCRLNRSGGLMTWECWEAYVMKSSRIFVATASCDHATLLPKLHWVVSLNLHTKLWHLFFFKLIAFTSNRNWL